MDGSYAFSEEAQGLRDTFVKSPWMVDDTYVNALFKTLRLHDMQISEVDDLVHFSNLEELSLTGNNISSLVGYLLPDSLQILQLYLNKISDVSSLSNNPPQLLHLGLGYNNICSISETSFPGSTWSSLMSIDLAFNNITNLDQTIQTLSLVPSLQSVVAFGNPISLLARYRQSFIGAIKTLTSLDDVIVTTEEGARCRSSPKVTSDDVVFSLSIANILNLPTPAPADADNPYAPINTYTYHLTWALPGTMKSSQQPSFTSEVSGQTTCYSSTPIVSSSHKAVLDIQVIHATEDVAAAKDLFSNGIIIAIQRTCTASVVTEAELESNMSTAKGKKKDAKTDAANITRVLLPPATEIWGTALLHTAPLLTSGSKIEEMLHFEDVNGAPIQCDVVVEVVDVATKAGKKSAEANQA